MTLAICAQYCFNQSYLYAGAQYMTQCYCGNSYGKFGFLDILCNYPCKGNVTQKCGGVGANTIMKTSLGVLNPVLTYTLQPGSAISSIVTYSDQLFLVRANISQVEVYNTSTFTLIRNISLPGAGNTLSGMAFSYIDNFLYVADFNGFQIFKVNTENNVTTNWSVCANTARPRGLSVTAERNVLVACTAINVTEEYTSNGSLVQQFYVGSNQPYHAMELYNGTLAMSVIGQFYGVCLMWTNGTIFAKSPVGKISGPRNLAVDYQGIMVVADQTNNQIVVINPTLADVRNLTLPVNGTSAINSPVGAWLDQSRGRLYVYEGGGKNRLLVYDNVFDLSAVLTML